jgi:hypothetical protein
MTDSLIFRAELTGHGGWVTALVRSLSAHG